MPTTFLNLRRFLQLFVIQFFKNSFFCDKGKDHERDLHPVKSVLFPSSFLFDHDSSSEVANCNLRPLDFFESNICSAVEVGISHCSIEVA